MSFRIIAHIIRIGYSLIGPLDTFDDRPLEMAVASGGRVGVSRPFLLRFWQKKMKKNKKKDAKNLVNCLKMCIFT